ncbi:MAG: GNAT family N-acetyltransferase [Neisseriaceae bacterium]
MQNIRSLPKCTYRNATLDDLDAIMVINDQFELNWTREKFLEVFENNIPIILAYNEDNIFIGYLVYFCILDEGRIINVAIDKKYQNRSYGKKLIHRSLEEMYEMNMHYALLDVKTDNYVAINLYTKMGFQILCRRINYYTGDVDGDAYFMQLKL